MRRLTAACLALCLTAVCLLQPLGLLAATVLTGTVHSIDDDSYLTVRKGPGRSYDMIGELYNNDVVTILETVTASDGSKWYKVSKGNLSGYSSAEYIKINVTYETDEEFEAYLTAQGFPEDYKVKLRQLRAEYPKWVFQAEHLSMTWAEALAAETKALKNAITSPDAWKSMEYGAYNWKTGTYEAVDSGGWVTASPALVAYYMDPRNFLDSEYIFQFEDLHYSEGQTVEGVKAILPSDLDKHAEDLIKASKETKVSAYFLATRMRQEGSHVNGLGLGTVKGYEGYYNFFNYGAYAGSQHGEYHGAVTNGAIYAKKQGWDTPYKCLRACAEKIGNGYINKEQDTLYYQKYDVTDGGNGFYNHQYMTNTEAAASEGKIRANAATTAERDSAITFVIPVYKEMPATVAPLPGKTGNNNNFLDSISVTGCTLTPSFDRYTMDYAAQVEGEVTEVEITAKLNSDAATITGGGKVQLKPGENVIPLTVTATSGQVRTYTLTITRDAPLEEEQLPVITGNSYLITDTITGVEPQTAVDKLLTALAVENGTAGVYTADGKEKTEGLVATGDIVRLYSGSVLCQSYPVVIYGDVNADGKVTSQDLRRAQRHILNVDVISGYALTAADANMDGKVNSQDLRKAQRHILGITASLQPAPITTTTSTTTTTTVGATSTTTTS